MDELGLHSYCLPPPVRNTSALSPRGKEEIRMAVLPVM
jgi:hypothetical protein